MVVVGYSPASGTIQNVIVQSPEGRFQTLSRSTNWYIGDRWTSEASAQFAFSQGFVQLPKPIEFDFFMKNLSQFE